MGIISNTVGICQFRVTGSAPKSDFFPWAGERLAARGFRSIEETTDELSTGWVHLDDFTARDFELPSSYQREHYLAFTMRSDRRKVPSILLKAHLEQSIEEFLAANPGRQRVPRDKRQDLLDAHRGRLLSRALPTPSTCDAVWDTRTGLLTVASLGAKTLGQFEELFSETFPGCGLTPEHPLARAERILPERSLRDLHAACGPLPEAVLERIERTRWLGWDFLAWVLYQTLNSPSEYSVNQPGPLLGKERFTAFIDDRIVLLHGEEGSPQKVTVVGPQHGFQEVRSALLSGKKISEAGLHLELGENHWSMTLRGERFHLASLKAPRVTIEKDALTDETGERIAVFFERMLLLEQGMQLLHSLYASFLSARLGSGWKETGGRMLSWLKEQQ